MLGFFLCFVLSLKWSQPFDQAPNQRCTSIGLVGCFVKFASPNCLPYLDSVIGTTRYFGSLGWPNKLTRPVEDHERGIYYVHLYFCFLFLIQQYLLLYYLCLFHHLSFPTSGGSPQIAISQSSGLAPTASYQHSSNMCSIHDPTWPLYIFS